METFRGISILTTNHDTAIDDAFRRRLTCRIEFQLPEAEERLKLWASLLSPASVGGQTLDLERLAERYVMSGGYIQLSDARGLSGRRRWNADLDAALDSGGQS